MNKEIITENLVCPHCHASLKYSDKDIACSSCGKKYSMKNGIPDFREEEEYWCNFSQDKMQKLNTMSKESGDWLTTAKKILPEYADHFIPFYRADAQFLWPTTKEAKVLDAGSMWGGITIPVAQFHGEVYAVDKTVETLEFLSIRAAQLGLHNIRTVVSDVKHLPFPDNYFDVVILNGVLEWVAFDDKLVLEKHWKKAGRGLKTESHIKYSEKPEITQLNVLKELNRVLKPDGIFHFAIENRIGYTYLAGYPDDHMNIPFICFLPRFIANAVTKIMLGCEYRTYVYTVRGYRSMLKKAGFLSSTIYGAFMHYINPSELIPFYLIKNLKWKILASKKGLHKIFLKLIPKSILPLFSPSVVIIASKGPLPLGVEPRIVQLLKKAGVIDQNVSDIEIVQCDSRPGNDHTVNYWIFSGDKKNPEYFCKISRTKNATDILTREAHNLNSIHRMIKDRGIQVQIPKLCYYGTIDGITFMVNDFMPGRRSSFGFNTKLQHKLKLLDTEIVQSISFLTQFQKYTTAKREDVFQSLFALIEKTKKELAGQQHLTGSIQGELEKLLIEVSKFQGVTIPLCGQHGDFDFFYNILFSENSVKVLDFEHFVPEALPFLDIGTLIINPLLVSYERMTMKLSFDFLLKKYDLVRYLTKWLKLYLQSMGMSEDFLPYVITLAALQQKTTCYPLSRDPATFPINIAFEELLKVRIQS